MAVLTNQGCDDFGGEAELQRGRDEIDAVCGRGGTQRVAPPTLVLRDQHVLLTVVEPGSPPRKPALSAEPTTKQTPNGCCVNPSGR